MEFSIPINCPDYAKDIIEGFKENKAELHTLIGKGILTKDIYTFEKSAEPIIGAEIDILRDFILRNYKQDKDKFRIKFNEFQNIIQEWANFESKAKEDNIESDSELINDMTPSISVGKRLEGSEEGSDQDEFENEAKENFIKIVELKIEKHYEKIKEIFENHSEEFQQKLKEEEEKKEEKVDLKSKQAESVRSINNKSDKSESGNESEGEGKDDEKSSKNEENKGGSEKGELSEKKEDENAIVIPSPSSNTGIQKTNIKLNKMKEVLNDIAYLTGLGILTTAEASVDSKPKRSSAKGIDEFTHFVWKRLHILELKEKQRLNEKKSILKHTTKEDEEKSENNSQSDVKSEEEHNHSEKPKKEGILNKIIYNRETRN